jgi:hypothetical protein
VSLVQADMLGDLPGVADDVDAGLDSRSCERSARSRSRVRRLTSEPKADAIDASFDTRLLVRLVLSDSKRGGHTLRVAVEVAIGEMRAAGDLGWTSGITTGAVGGGVAGALLDLRGALCCLSRALRDFVAATLPVLLLRSILLRFRHDRLRKGCQSRHAEDGK